MRVDEFHGPACACIGSTFELKLLRQKQAPIATEQRSLLLHDYRDYQLANVLDSVILE